MLDRIKNEPALALGAVQALLTVLVAFGLPLTEPQIVGVLTLSGALLALLTRQLVTPMNKLKPPAGTRSEPYNNEREPEAVIPPPPRMPSTHDDDTPPPPPPQAG